MIIVTGATGVLNGATVEHLLTLVPADQIGVSVRDTEKARHFAERGVRVRRGSYEDPAALLDSFEGADQVLLVSSNEPFADQVSLHRVGIETAVRAGARRILYTSHQHVGADSPFAPAVAHAATEAMLADSGVAWTSLRNGFYAHSLDWLLGPWRETGVIAAPADGPVSWTARADSAEAAAVILAGERRFDGPVTITASAAPTFDDIAVIASELTGRDIRRVILDDDKWLAEQTANGTPEPMARYLLGFFQAARTGAFAEVNPLLADLLAREPRTVRDALALRWRSRTCRRCVLATVTSAGAGSGDRAARAPRHARTYRICRPPKPSPSPVRAQPSRFVRTPTTFRGPDVVGRRTRRRWSPRSAGGWGSSLSLVWRFWAGRVVAWQDGAGSARSR
jgi:NAD(P)H dehydrogenase (quinone)